MTTRGRCLDRAARRSIERPAIRLGPRWLDRLLPNVDVEARAVLTKHLPPAATGPMFGLLAQFAPDMPIDAMFGNWMMRAPDADPEQAAALKARLYAELAEIEPADVGVDYAFDGETLVPMMQGEVSSHESEFYITECTWMRKHGWRTPEWKLVRDFLNPERDELYDLKNDPDENHNLIHEPSPRMQAVVRQLDAQIRRHKDFVRPGVKIGRHVVDRDGLAVRVGCGGAVVVGHRHRGGVVVGAGIGVGVARVLPGARTAVAEVPNIGQAPPGSFCAVGSG